MRCFVLHDLLLNLSAELRNLLIKIGKLRLYGAEPRIGVLRDLAGSFKIVAHFLRALSEQLGHESAKRNEDGKDDDGGVNDLKEARSSLNFQMKNSGQRLHHGGVKVLVVVLFLRRLALLGMGSVGCFRRLRGDRRLRRGCGRLLRRCKAGRDMKLRATSTAKATSNEKTRHKT